MADGNNLIYKRVLPSDQSTEESVVSKKQTFTNTDAIFSFQYVSGSVKANSNGLPTKSGSYWQSLRVNFYTSGSYASTDKKLKNSYFSFGLQNNKQYRHKFYSNGTLISIPQKYFGESIIPGTFKLTDNSLTGTNGKSPTIVDDGNGNIYSSNAANSHSKGELSSSTNYVGNIFYNTGIVTLTETGSWSGSINYTMLATNTGSYKVEFESQHTIFIKEYNVHINPNEFLYTGNISARALRSGSVINGVNQYKAMDRPEDSPVLRNELTGSVDGVKWSPYLTTIGLYGELEKSPNMPAELIHQQEIYPSIVARLPQPVKMIDWGKITFKIRLDY